MDFQELNWITVIARILLSAGMGCMIGMERESRNRPAGFRTYTLVSVGACLIMMTNQYLYSLYHTGDPARLGAQVISGIGFLGAGTILVTKNSQVKGLTTAAGLWACACVGLAIGIGFYIGAIGVGCLLLLVLVFCRPLDRIVRRKNGYIRLYVHFDSSDDIDRFLKLCKEEKVRISDMHPMMQKDEGTGGIVVIVDLTDVTCIAPEELEKKVLALSGVRHVEEI